MEVEVTGIAHVYVTVRDLDRSQEFYDRVMAVLGFRKAAGPLADGDFHVRRGIDATEPRGYPEYSPDYYATFFCDPDGIRLEVMNHTARLTRIGENWDSIPPIEA